MGLNISGNGISGMVWNKRVLWNGTKRKKPQCIRSDMMAAWVVTFSELGHSVWISRGKVCQMCDMGEDKSVEHVVLECEKYKRDRMEIMQVILTELGHS